MAYNPNELISYYGAVEVNKVKFYYEIITGTIIQGRYGACAKKDSLCVTVGKQRRDRLRRAV